MAKKSKILRSISASAKDLQHSGLVVTKLKSKSGARILATAPLIFADPKGIDGCEHTFAYLSVNVLPKYLEALRRKMKKPHSLAKFAKEREGVASIVKSLNKPADFAGCYVIIDRDVPIYVGISRKVVARLRQHVRGKTHFEASLAYRMACKAKPHKNKRGEAMMNSSFSAAFRKKQSDLQKMKVAFLEIRQPLERYLFEVLCAMEFRTSKWNTFETH